MQSYAGTWLSGVVLSAALVSTALGLNAPTTDTPTAQLDSTVSTPGVLEVHVVDHRGAPVETRVTGCRDHVFPAANVRLETGRSCTVQARRRDGIYWTPWTAPVTATTGHLAIDLPDYTMGGLGVRISATRDGAFVQSVESRSVGRRLGLEPGDVIARANGVALAGLDSDAMVSAITGPTGSPVVLDIIDVRSGRVVHRTGNRAPMR